MSLISMLLASFGIGAATVDTKLQKNQYVAGDTIKGVVEVRGGRVAQTIDKIYLMVFTTYLRQQGSEQVTDSALIKQFSIDTTFTIQPNELKILPFQIILPLDTPITVGNTAVWIQTGLNIKNALNARDRDYIRVEPTFFMDTLASDLRLLGFALLSADCKESPKHVKIDKPFMQIFDYTPTNYNYQQHIEKLTVNFLQHTENCIRMHICIKKQHDNDLQHIGVQVFEHDLAKLTRELRQILTDFT